MGKVGRAASTSKRMRCKEEHRERKDLCRGVGIFGYFLPARESWVCEIFHIFGNQAMYETKVLQNKIS